MLTMAGAATAIAQRREDAPRLRVFFEFMRAAVEDGLTDEEILDAVKEEPATIGDDRFDTLLAAAAEHVTAERNLRAPDWALDARRQVRPAWWVSDLPSYRAYALVWVPPAFERRGIFLDRHDLEVA